MILSDSNKVSIHTIAVYSDESEIGKSMYIDIDINEYWVEDIPYSLDQFKKGLIETNQLEFFINYLKQ